MWHQTERFIVSIIGCDVGVQAIVAPFHFQIKNTMNAIIYYRVSTEDQAEKGVSLEQQKRACLDYARHHCIDVQEIFHDDGVSAKTTNRKGLQALLEHCAKNHKKTDCVIVYKIDRLSRNMNDYSSIDLMLKKLNIQLISTTENIDNSPTGKFIGHVMAANAQLDNDLKSERISSCMEEKLKQGVWVWKAPIGYVNGRDGSKKTIDVDPERAPHIKWVFEQFVKGVYTLEEIRQKANKRGLRTENGKEITAQTMSKIINRTFYHGVMYVESSGNYYPGTHKSIITEEIYYRCQEIIAQKNGKSTYKTKKEKSQDFPLRNFVHCTYCARPLTAAYSTGKSGKKYPFYRCYNKDCGKLKSVAKDKLEKAFVKNLVGLTPNESVLKAQKVIIMDLWKNRYKDIEKDRKASQAALERLEEEKKGLIGMKTRELISDADFKDSLDELSARIQKFHAKHSQLQHEEIDLDKVISIVFEQIKDLPTLWKKSDYDKKLLLQGLIFSEKPRYGKDGFGTPHVSLILAQNKGFGDDESSVVIPRRIELRFSG